MNRIARSRRVAVAALLLASAVALVASVPACSSSSAAPAASADAAPTIDVSNPDCDPTVPEHCGFPFPSNRWTRDDAASPTGKRVAFGATTLPRWKGATHLDPAGWAESDGFSPGQAPLTYLPGATTQGLPTQDTIDASLADDSPTVLLEADTLARVPHFAELDASYPNDDAPTFMIRPVVRLNDATRYIVAIRHVVDASGAPIPPSPAFRALRDGTAAPDAVLARKPVYDDIFAKLRAARIDTSDLQIAWDYTTASRDNNTRALLHMRDDALAAVGPDGPPYVVTKVEDDPNPHVRKRITGVMTVPLYLDSAKPGGKLVVGPDGLPKRNGTMDVEFLVHVPNSLFTKKEPGPLVQNGHGLLGTKAEGQDGYLAQIADSKGYVAFGIDLTGFASEDVGFISDTLVGDVGGFRDVVARQQQGIVNSLLAMRLMKGRFTKDPNVTVDGVGLIDPTRCYYRGDSQGGIMGTTYMALTTDVTRGLLGEPGFPYNLLLNRSADFGAFALLLHTNYRTGADNQLVLGLVQMLWDRSEPDGYAPYVVDAPLPNTPKHDVLVHVAIGDHQVTPLGAHLLARTLKAKNVAPVNRTVWGVPEASPPLAGPAMVEYDFGLPESPKTNRPPSQGDDPHDKLRELPSAQDQADTFFREGVVKSYCSGPCKGP